MQSLLKQLASVKDKLLTDLGVIKAMHKKLVEQTASTSQYMCKKLKQHYANVIDLGQQESDLLSAISIASQKVINTKASKAGGVGAGMRQSSIINTLDNSLPVWPDSQPGPLCGALSPANEWNVTPGHQVAACVSAKDDPEQRWILGTVVKFSNKKEEYIVEDIMEETASSAAAAKERHFLHKDKVLALPQWACYPGILNTFHPAGEKILALYPQTTCFYPAVVHKPPTHEKPNIYVMHFFDDDYEDGRTRYQEVAVRFVVDAHQRTKMAITAAKVAKEAKEVKEAKEAKEAKDKAS